MDEPRDVMADRFDRMPGLLHGYDVADAFITALADAGYVIVRESELERSFLAGMHQMRPGRAAAGSGTPDERDDAEDAAAKLRYRYG